MIVKSASGGKYRIEVQSEKGKGSRFWFKAEFSYGRKTEDRRISESTAPLGDPPLILLVDDDSDMRFVYSKMKVWNECGFRIAKEASNGRDN